eukprot:gene63368-86688_t
MSNVEYYTTDMRSGALMGSVTMHDRLSRGRVMSQPIERFGVISGMIETADNLARDYQISREECDEYAAMSHQRATAAWAAGKFDDELVPVSVKQKKGDPIIFDRDEGFRPDATAETLGQLRAIEKGGVVTAGNASQQNDAASACLVITIKLTDEFSGWLAEIKDGMTQLRLRKRLRKATLGNLGDVKPVGEGVMEMREFFGPGWRMYYVQRGEVLIVMLGGGDKS